MFRGKFRFRLIVKDEYQPLRVVSPLLWSVAVIALVGQIVFTLYVLESPTAKVQQLQTPPSQSVLRLSALGDPVALARVLMIDLQGFDNQKGVSLPFNQLDYDVLGEWLDAIVGLDERAEYPHFSAAKLYSSVEDTGRKRKMVDWVWRQFLAAEDSNSRWEWMAYAANLAHYVLKDEALSLLLARELRENTIAGKTPGWARQMEAFFLENQNEYDAAANMLALQLESGDVTDPQEFIFLLNRLEGMLNDMVKRGEIKDEAGLRNLWDRLGELQGQYLRQFDLGDK